MRLQWHSYKYYPYEKELALREVNSLLTPACVRQEEDAVIVVGSTNTSTAKRLVYFASAMCDGQEAVVTQQRTLERVNGNGAGRQSTRYSAHGLHEYKGKFNPQVAKAILNIFGAEVGQRAIDPFCGSGTSLVECAHLGIRALGTDINPMAIYIANAKLLSLGIAADSLSNSVESTVKRAKQSKAVARLNDARSLYLGQWFTKEVHSDIERLRKAVDICAPDQQPILLAIASNLLRDYSLQDPHDLRIRRRKSPLPDMAFLPAFERAAGEYLAKLKDAQRTIGVRPPSALALQADARGLERYASPCEFDLALTSPPYATALPYIDTQRLSLVWLGLVEPTEILELDSRLVGSRELRGTDKKLLLDALKDNQAELPAKEAQLCLDLQTALSERDGFRRQAVPKLLYRYFAQMKEAFESLHPLMKPNAPFGLIVGGNHTTLGGRRFEINTPQHLTSLAVSSGWRHVETIPLQTYQRFGLHMVNSTSSEALVILQA